MNSNYAPPLSPSHILSSPFSGELARDALRVYQAYAENPLSIDATIALAQECLNAQSFAAGKHLLRRAIQLDSRDPQFSLRCAKLARKLGMPQEAFDCATIALSRDEDKSEAYAVLARGFADEGETDAALRMLELGYRQNAAEGYLTAVAEVLSIAGRYAEALDWAKRNADRISEREATILIGRCLSTEQSTIDEAIQLFENWLADHPDDHDIYSFITSILLRQPGYSLRCLKWCEQGIRAFPKSPFLHFHKAWTLLATGHWKPGWLEYEWRWDTGGTYDSRFLRPLIVRDWIADGQPKGRRIFVHGEQGFGDNFMFLKFLPLLRASFEEIVLGVFEDLVEICSGLKIADEVVSLKKPAPTFDSHIALCSLPLALKLFTTEALEAACSRFWRPSIRLFPPPKAVKPRIGLVWGGRPLSAEDYRSIPADQIKRFLQEESGVTFVLLQKGIRNVMVDDELVGRIDIIDCRNRFHDWAEVAQVLLQLDGLLTVDTGIAHLAGLMGVQTALLLTCAPDWRWMDCVELPQFRKSTLWYRTLRVFRSEGDADFMTVLRDGCSYLKALTGNALDEEELAQSRETELLGS